MQKQVDIFGIHKGVVKMSKKTGWQGLWKQRDGLYAGKKILKKDLQELPTGTHLIIRYNRFYEAGTSRPKFVYCFADKEATDKMSADLTMQDYYYAGKTYTEEEVYKIIHGIEIEYGLEYGNNLIEDYL